MPNGAWTKNYAMAIKLKREGMRKGVPDWILPFPKWVNTPLGKGHDAGLAIEFKRPGGIMTPEQVVYCNLLKEAGWRVEVCTSWEAARAIVQDYLAG